MVGDGGALPLFMALFNKLVLFLAVFIVEMTLVFLAGSLEESEPPPFLSVTPIALAAEIIEPEPQPEKIEVKKVPVVSKEVIEFKIDWYADKYGVDVDSMRKVIYCENRSLNPLAQSGYKSETGPNGREDSWGLVQIHLPSHPHITRAQAQDVDFSLNFIAKAFSEGKQRMWSCWRAVFN